MKYLFLIIMILLLGRNWDLGKYPRFFRCYRSIDRGWFDFRRRRFVRPGYGN